eukprot:4014925-Prymnesium_polylepis.1
MALESGHLSKRQRIELGNLADAVHNLPDELRQSVAGKAVTSYFGWVKGGKAKAKAERDDTWD